MAISLSFFVCCVLLVASLLSAAPNEQVPLIKAGDGKRPKEVEIMYQLKKAEIVPTVFDETLPLLTVHVTWSNASAKLGNTIHPDLVQKEPKIRLVGLDPSEPGIWSEDESPQLTVAMTDPDAPSRENPEWSEICHWIVTNVPYHDTDEDLESSIFTSKANDVMPYKPPGPPPKTWKHRYVFVALAARNLTTAPLNLRKPDSRQHWGYEYERFGLREWADEMGLGVVGANFIYSKNDEQE